MLSHLDLYSRRRFPTLPKRFLNLIDRTHKPLTCRTRAEYRLPVMSDERAVLITGCSAGGIGSALAKDFHSQGSFQLAHFPRLNSGYTGFRVFATSRRLESMDDLSALGIETLLLDVTDVEAIRCVKNEIAIRTGGKLDILVNNALNLLCLPCIPTLKFEQGDGQVVHITSIIPVSRCNSLSGSRYRYGHGRRTGSV